MKTKWKKDTGASHRVYYARLRMNKHPLSRGEKENAINEIELKIKSKKRAKTGAHCCGKHAALVIDK